MNLLLFEAAEIHQPLPRNDARAVHLLEVLRRKMGERFDAGVINGPRGKGTLVAIGPDALTLSFAWENESPPLDPITLIIGLPRPQTARDILRDATSLGVSALEFIVAEKSEPGYQRSTLWTGGEWRRHLIMGAEQAFDTRLPAVRHGGTLPEALGRLAGAAARLALDNYEADAALSQTELIVDAAPNSAAPAAVLAFGPERGWSPAERELLRAQHFSFVHLGSRVLRLETAVTAAVAVVKAKRGLM